MAFFGSRKFLEDDVAMFGMSCPICWEKECNCSTDSYRDKEVIGRLEREVEDLKAQIRKLKNK